MLEQLAEELLAASRALVAITTRALSADAPDLTLVQYRCLVVLAFEGPTATTALAADVGVHQSTVTRASEQLVHRGLAVKRRDEDDRRRTIVALTAQGQALIDSVMSQRREALLAVLSTMRPADAAVTVLALAAFTAQASRTRPDA